MENAACIGKHVAKCGPHVDGFLGSFAKTIEYAKGGNKVFLSDKCGDGSRSRLPVAEAERGEDNTNCLADILEQGVFHGITRSAIKARQEAKGTGATVPCGPTKVGKRPYTNGSGKDDGTGLYDIGGNALPHVHGP